MPGECKKPWKGGGRKKLGLSTMKEVPEPKALGREEKVTCKEVARESDLGGDRLTKQNHTGYSKKNSPRLLVLTSFYPCAHDGKTELLPRDHHSHTM